MLSCSIALFYMVSCSYSTLWKTAAHVLHLQVSLLFSFVFSFLHFFLSCSPVLFCIVWCSYWTSSQIRRVMNCSHAAQRQAFWIFYSLFFFLLFHFFLSCSTLSFYNVCCSFWTSARIRRVAKLHPLQSRFRFEFFLFFFHFLLGCSIALFFMVCCSYFTLLKPEDMSQCTPPSGILNIYIYLLLFYYFIIIIIIFRTTSTKPSRPLPMLSRPLSRFCNRVFSYNLNMKAQHEKRQQKKNTRHRRRGPALHHAEPTRNVKQT
jgi:hypothetical protein